MTSPDTAPAGPAVSALELNQWLAYQLYLWRGWAAGRDAAWLATATGNERWPTAGALYEHAFTPLHRYADMVAGVEPHPGEGIDHASWDALLAWALTCLQRHREVCSNLPPGRASGLQEFKTRSYGVVKASVAHCLCHAATHCAWHLGGIAHLLRAQGIDPPQKSDMLFWAIELTQ